MFSKTLILLLALLLMQQVHTQSTSLCIDCLTTFSGYCIACKTTGNNCMIGSTYNANTKLCQCNSMFYQAKTTAGNPYCQRCFVGCLTCSGPLATNCLTCVSNFTYNSNNSTCSQPATNSDYSVQFAYYFLKFNLLSNWLWGSTSTTYLHNGNSVYTCNSYTLAGLARAQYITGTFSSLQNHFQVRVMFAHYYFATSVNQNIFIDVSSASVNVPLVGSFNLANNPNISCLSGAQAIQTMVDQSLTHTSSSLSLAITTTQSGATNVWGIRQIFVQIRLCHSSCTSCTGYTYDKCTGCADGYRISTYTGYSGICVCYGNGSYVNLMYQQSSGNTCVSICPNIPTETFGDNVTRNCLAQCPNNSYAYTDVYRCWADCPKTSIVTGQLLFKDKLNWRCVPNCPSATPYGNAENNADRFCYAVCPNRTNTASYPTDYYAVDGISPRCVSVCPYNSTFQLFGYQGKCIPLCPTGTWGDPATKLCVSNCTNSPYLYKQNSTGQNICVMNCSYPNNFRDNTTGTCVTACPSPFFGQTNRECKTQCAAGSFGLPFDTRQCTSFCPDGWWGEPDKAVCVNTSLQCKTVSNNRYADNYTRKCVLPSGCSLGWWAENVTQMCQSNCVKANSPNNISGASVGNPSSRTCQSACTGGLFADYVAGLCVSSCITNNTYADVYSSYSCVTACNIAGSTPWADNNTWTCVSSCNTTGISNAVRDNTTWQCVFECPPNYYADFITTNNPICRSVCLSNTYADNSTGTGLCVYICSVYPARFGDATNGMNLCVAVCSVNLFGDQTGNRTCVSLCPSGYFAQNDTTRRCVPKCKPGTYGQNRWCNTDPFNCTVNTFANDANNLCDACSAVQSTWGDNTTKRCVTQCPLNSGVGPITYYADISIRQCTLRCSSSYVTGATSIYSVGLWGNNNTRTCEFICLDLNAYVQGQFNNPYRVCVAKCHPLPAFHYANNYTKVCGPSINCPTNTFGQNNTQLCVNSCPTGTYGYQTSYHKICINVCPGIQYGQNSTGVNLCVTQCASIPPLYADPVTKLCLPACSAPYYADPTTRKCVLNCPYSVTPYYAYQLNRTCITVCPNNYFANFALQNISGLPLNTNISRCVTPSSSCGVNRWGDPYLHKCVAICTGPSPVNLFAYWPDCVATCPTNYYANTYNGARICVQLCPPSSVGTAPPNLYGDPTTMTCVSRCITPLTWADYQTRLCQPTCSATPVPTYSENFYFTCVTSLNCPTTPSITFGDNSTRSCVSNCSLGKFGDPTSRNCVTQCPNVSTTLTSTYYSDISTGVYVCVVICPIKPALFGLNATNTCVDTCPVPLYGDQTGNRTCLAVCPLIGATVWFAQNTSRICVTVCIAGTWGYTASRECVQLPTQCQSQWADNSTNLCVNVCPATANTFADPTTKLCVPFCPATYYAGLTTRTCVQTCPSSVEEHGTFGNNETRTCSEVCNLLNGSITYADPQTVNRYCVLQCSQSPLTAFADPSTATCVPKCPTFPSLYGQTTTFTCVAACTGNTYADTNARLCVTNCPSSTYKQTSPNTCVSVCPFDEINPLYGDPNNNACVTTCTNNYFRYNTLSICVPSCSAYSLFAYNMTCVKLCPSGYYANSSGICVSTCPATTYGENSTTACISTCLTGFASGSLCVAVCPNGSYGENFVCVNSCQNASNIASSINNLCIATCTGITYSQNGLCSTTCINGTYADPFTHLCSSSCTNSRYGDPTTNTCVTQCPQGYYKDSTGYCLSACLAPKFADNVTWSCTPLCSTGYWGYNLLCVTVCPTGYFGYLVDRICYTVPNRPVSSPVYFAENITQTWVTVCPVSPLTFGDITLRYCISNCQNGTFADPANRRCNGACQNSSYFADSTTNQCVMVCPNGYFANSNTGLCQNICSSGYAYSLSRKCVSTCPSPYSGYENGTAKICVSKCPLNYYSYNRVCSSSCPATYYADNATNQCLLSCVNSFASDDAHMCVSDCSSYANYKFADNSSNTCVNLCPNTPDYYVDNFFCVFTCSAGKFADPTPGVRACTTLCTTGLFSDPLSGRCMSSCPLGYWAQNVTNNCVSQCVSGSFADNITGKCVAACPSPTYADSTTQRCVKTCPTGYFGEVTNICVSKCTLPNYANPLTRRCEPTCPASAKLYAQNTTASCVLSCSIVANSYADPAINVCVSACTLANFYALDGQGICTDLCPLGLFMQNSTKKCQATCTTGFAQPTTRYCVAKCFGNPQTYGYNKVCHYKCLNATYNLYADNSTSMCVSTCPSNVFFFSDPLSGNCVLFCPDGYFAQNTTWTCTQTCLVGFADNLTRKCVAVCPSASQQTYGDPSTNRCVRVCPTNTYAENVTKQCVASNACPGISWSDKVSKYCVSRCPSIPLTFGLNSTTSCVQRCPFGLFGDFVTQTCVSSCFSVNGQYRFADPITQTCVYVCPIKNSLYGDTLITGNFTCTSTCSAGQLRDNSTQRCVSLCPVNPNYWADLTNYICVYTCPLNYFASSQSHRLCVIDCSIYQTFGDINARVCTNICPINYYADNSTYLCVLACPFTPDYYADNTTVSCVKNCPKTASWTTYSDPISRKCVTLCPSGYFARNDTQRCVQTCPSGSYADPIIRICVSQCTVRPHYYKHTNLTCVYECPTSPMSYKYDGNHSCVYVDNNGYTGCPSGYWANPLDNMCTTLCPADYFAEQTKQLCVTICPNGYFADPVDRLCKTDCSLTPEYYRLSLTIGTCVQFCPSPYFSDNSTYDCVQQCPLNPLMYAYEITRNCVQKCPPPYYSYIVTRQCLLTCPTPYFSQDSTRSCELGCTSPYFADNSTNRCVISCPDSPIMFGYNNNCVYYCPLNFYADNSTRLCVSFCPTQPTTFAQNSTRTCVIACPSTPNSFANNITMQCVAQCPNNTFADTISRSCVLHCPSTQMTYADPTTHACQSACPSPYFASDLTKQCVTLCPNTPQKTYALTTLRTCVFKCPNGLFGQNTTRTCATDCPQDLTAFADVTSNLCVSTCPFGWFADNTTFACVRNCPQGAFADNYTRRCLLRCPGTQRLYSDSTTLTCVSECPTGSYGNDFNWTCILNCPISVSGYKLDISHLCVAQCPSPYFAFLPTRTCVINCGAGLYGDTATRICKSCNSSCPTCLSQSQCLTCTPGLYLSFGACLATCPPTTYASNQTMSCIYPSACPSGTYANKVTQSCTTTCPPKQFPDKINKLCTDCPATCASCNSTSVCITCVANAAYSNVTTQCYAYCEPSLQYNYAGNCYSRCPQGSYLDYTNVNCQACNSICKTCFGAATNCTSCDTSYFFNRTCVSKCPKNYFSANQTCLLCNNSIPACVKPLTFNTTTRTQNYQSVIYLQFNQDVKIQGNPTSFISLNLKVNRRLQDYSTMMNNGLPYTATVMPDGTIKIILDPSVTLVNPSFTVSINDPSKITTKSGATLQSLTTAIQNIVVNSYPPGTTQDAPLVVAGTILSVLMLLILALVFLCSPVPIYLSLQAFQMIAFYAFITDLAPNFFYFLKRVSLTRLSFLPNILSGVYHQPNGYISYIPSRATQIDGKLSFAANAGNFVFVAIIYFVVGFVIKAISTKSNPNRPLRQIFQKLYQTRVKWSIIWDMFWIFGLNVMVCGFLQFKYTANSGDLAVAIMSLIIFISLPIFAFFYRIKRFDPENPSDVDNFRLIHQGLKQGKSQYMPYIFMLRRLLFAIIIATTAGGSSQSQYSSLMTISCLMMVILIVLRPYQETLRNIVHIANQVGLTALGVGCVYYKRYVDILQPVGTKVMNGTILTGGMIAHLSIAIIWAIYRTYHFYKEIYNDFKATEFYTLYLDEQFDESLEKELQELNDQSGDVQEVEVCNSTQLGDQNEGEETIKLKIKRRRKVKKGQAEQKILPRRDQGEYIKVSENNQSIIEIEQPKHQFKKQIFQPEIITIKEKDPLKNIFAEDAEKSEEAWVEVNNREQLLSVQQASAKYDHSLLSSPKGANEHVFLPIDSFPIEDSPPNKEIPEISQISSVSHKEQAISKDEGENLRQSISQIPQNEERRNEYNELMSNKQEQIINAAEVVQNSPREPEVHHQQPIHHEQIEKSQTYQQNKQNWRQMSQWDQVNPLQPEKEPQYEEIQSEVKQNPKIVIDLDQEQHEQIAKQPREKDDNNKWNIEIEDLMAGEQKKAPNSKHLMLFDLQDFE